MMVAFIGSDHHSVCSVRDYSHPRLTAMLISVDVDILLRVASYRIIGLF